MSMFFAAMIATAMISGSSDPVEMDPTQMENAVVYDEEMDPLELKKLKEMADEAINEIVINDDADPSDFSEDEE